LLQLALLVDDVVVKFFPLDKPLITIGRHQGNDIQIDDARVSARHAQIRIEPSEQLQSRDDILLEDLGSTNGTSVNGDQVDHCELRANDVITVVDTRFKLLDTGRAGITTTVPDLKFRPS